MDRPSRRPPAWLVACLMLALLVVAVAVKACASGYRPGEASRDGQRVRAAQERRNALFIVERQRRAATVTLPAKNLGDSARTPSPAVLRAACEGDFTSSTEIVRRPTPAVPLAVIVPMPPPRRYSNPLKTTAVVLSCKHDFGPRLRRVWLRRDGSRVDSDGDPLR